MKIIQALLVPFKGFVIGSSMSVPGVSGGTMAILLGIYDRLIAAISHFGSDVKKNALFLLLLGSDAITTWYPQKVSTTL